MHIKQITISNFRSFKQQPEIQPFSPATNCVVGRNGSGKSNLFDAVQFVLLSPRFYTLRTEERQALLHEGSGSTAVNAFVEIVFDNSDNRFSLENSDEVVLRRTIGHKKDEFFLQRKRANKAEIMSLLEGAGFSKSNPYYIVQQGKVNALCTMNDAERLRLLMEVAGTTVYDEKKAESLVKMEENKSSIEKINEILDTIEQRLTELHGEKEELTQYQKLDRDRRAIEYTLYDKELRKARETLDEIEHNRNEETEALSVLHEEARATHDAVRSVEAQMKSKTNALRRNRIQMNVLEEDKTRAMTARTKLELECRELEESLKTGEEIRKANEAELKKLAKEITQAEESLEKDVEPAYFGAVEVLDRLRNERDEAKKKVEGLYAKQGRGRQFNTRADRDAYLSSHVKELQTAKTEKEGQLGEQRDALSNLRRSIESETGELEKLKARGTSNTERMQAVSKDIESNKREKVELHDKRRDLWRTSEELHEKTKDARENVYRCQSDMRKVMPRATSMGLSALETIVQQERLIVGEQYFGMVMENLELVDSKFQTAVEVAAQNSLFHVIVDNDATAARLMKRLEDRKLGRVTFLPLNRLRLDAVTYPQSPDVKPLLAQCIKYEPKVESAMRHVFARKLLARNVEVAANWSSKSGMDTITLDGDLCSSKGALSGGYVDPTRSRLMLFYQHKEAQETLHKARSDHQHATRKAQTIDQSVSNLMGEQQRLEARHADISHSLREVERETQRTQAKISHQKKNLETIEKTNIPSLERDIASLKSEVQRLEDEMATEMTTTLTEQERQTLTQLKGVQVELGTEIESQAEKVNSLSVERERLQSLLKDNLLKRRQELMDQSTGQMLAAEDVFSPALAQGKVRDDLEQRNRELEDAVRVVDGIDARLTEARGVDDNLRAELVGAKNEFEQLKTKDLRNTRALEEAQEKAERLLNKRSMVVSKRELYMRKIQELGSLPPPAELASYADLSISALMRELDKVNKQLKKYSHVNKKAYDQYVNFSEQRENLLKRKEELDRGAEKVQELIESLDRQKDEAINRTFRGVSAHFKDVFRELVPQGGGELIMKTAIDDREEAEPSQEAEEENDDGDEDDAEDTSESEFRTQSQSQESRATSNPDVSLFRGIGIKVRFSRVGENYLMSQLSGGQKALVALALIFAIQRCDPAPFYLFDELDQALDSTYRAAVASLIQRQASSTDNPTQFIVSTFRPELVAVANRCYGISHQNKVSSVHHLSKKDALHFIANLMNEEEAVGEVTSLPASHGTRTTSDRKRKIAEPEEQSLLTEDDPTGHESIAADDESGDDPDDDPMDVDATEEEDD